jgi:RecJ-like exonuclease
MRPEVNMSEACRSCDGRGFSIKHERIGNTNYFDSLVSKSQCSKCQGTGKVLPPAKGKRFFGMLRDDNEDPSIEDMTRAFLRKHGY